jgi:serine/threonine-protein kinase HipA
MRTTVAHVYYGDSLAGILSRDLDRAETRFHYVSDYLEYGHPIAYNLPLRSQEFVTKGLHPFFDSMVSEGWLKRLQVNTQRIDPGDRFELLVLNGNDLPGLVSIRVSDEL